MTYLPHSHGYVRRRRLPTPLIWLVFRLGLGRLVVAAGSLPHDPECTADVAVTHTGRWLA